MARSDLVLYTVSIMVSVHTYSLHCLLADHCIVIIILYHTGLASPMEG